MMLNNSRIPALKILWFSVLVCFLSNAFAQEHKASELKIGLCFQKVTGLYWENGVAARFSSDKIFEKKLALGLNLLSSSFGSGLGTNAIPIHIAEISSAYLFGNSKWVRPFCGLNIGYAFADYPGSEFKDIPNSSVLASAEAGLECRFSFPVSISLSGGWNFITGNGMKGLGLIYPLHGKLGLLYNFPF